MSDRSPLLTSNPPLKILSSCSFKASTHVFRREIHLAGLAFMRETLSKRQRAGDIEGRKDGNENAHLVRNYTTMGDASMLGSYS